MILIIISLLVKSQRLILDSRFNLQSQAHLDQFQQNFSIWITYNNTNNLEMINIINITNGNNLMLSLSIQNDKIFIETNYKNIEIENKKQIERAVWQHIIINKNNNFENNEFLINFQNLKRDYKVNLNNFSFHQNYFLISRNSNQSFCLAYDSVSDQILPIVQSTNFQHLIQPHYIGANIYYLDSYFEVFIKKHKNIYQNMEIIDIYYSLQNLFSLKENDNILKIYSHDGKNMSCTQEVYHWFRILISFSQNITSIEITFINEKIQISVQSFVSNQIFYQIMISQFESNYQFMKFSSYFRIQTPIRFEQDDLKTFNNCQTGDKYYYQYETNTCQKYSDLDKIKILSHQSSFDINSLHKNEYQYQNIGEVIQSQLFANISNTFNFPYLEDYHLEQQFMYKDIFLVWKSQYYSICMRNYFGQSCRSYFQNCLLISDNNKCIQCSYGYVLINSKCQKCQKGCLICQFESQKQRCILPIQQFFVNFKGLATICQCEYCNNKGDCVTQQKINEFIDKSMHKVNLQQNCLQWEYFILEKLKCVLFLEDKQLQLLYYLPYSQEIYYQLSDLQFIILQNLQIYGPSLLSNKILSNYYLAVQIIKQFEQLQTQKLIGVVNYHLNRFNLECKQTKFNQYGQTICHGYQNVNNSKCLKLPCLYGLEITNVTYFIGSKSFIVYNNFQYFSMKELLNSIKEIGIEYTSVKIDINFMMQNEIQIIYFDQVQYIDLHNHSNSNINNSIMEINLQFLQIQNFDNNKIVLRINADKIKIQDQNINFNLHLVLNANNIFINNLNTDSEGILSIEAFKGTLLIMSAIKISGQFSLMIDGVKYAEINNLQSSNESSTSLNLNNIQELYIFNSYIFSDAIEEDCLISIFNVTEVKIYQLMIQFFKITNQFLINLLSCTSLYINNLQLIGNIIDDSLLFLIDETIYTNIINFGCDIKEVRNSQIFFINSLGVRITEFNQKSDIIMNSTQLSIQTYELNIVNYNTNSVITQLRQFISISTGILLISNFQIQQQSSIDMVTEENFIQGYLINIQIEYDSYIQLFQINGIHLFNFGLLFLKSKAKIIIEQMAIYNIYCLNNFENKFITFKEYSTNPEIIIQGLVLQNILFDNQIQGIFNVIEIQNYAFTVLNLVQVDKIYANNILDQAFIFHVDCKLFKLSFFKVTDCRKISFINLQSKEISISNVRYENKHNQEYIFKIHNNKSILIEIKNCHFELLNQLVLYANSSISLLIIIQDISIITYQISSQFILHGFGMEVRIQNISLSHLYSPQQFDTKQRVFEINYAKLQVYNLIAKNLRQQIFSFWYSPFIILSNCFINNTNPTDGKFLLKNINSPLILNGFKIENIENCEGIFFIILIQEILLSISYLQIKNSQNVNNIFAISTNILQKRIVLNDIYLQNYQGGNIFQFKSSQIQSVQVNNFYIFNSNNILFNQNIVNISLNNSILSETFNFSFEQTNLKLYSSEIIFIQYMLAQQIELERSLIFDQSNLKIVSYDQFWLTISLNNHNYLKSVKLNDFTDNHMQFQVTFTNQTNSQQYFYVPSGFKLYDYKRLHLKSLQYQQVYQGFYLILQGSLYGQSKYTLQCSQYQYYNNIIIENTRNFQTFKIYDGVNDISEQIFVINPKNSNYTEFNIVCQTEIGNKTIELKYYVKAFPCQLGEYLYKNQCLECNISQSLYSVSYNSSKCNYIDYNKIKQVKKGLLNIQQYYWRYKYNSNIIEYCDSDYCNGGWVPGDQSCVRTRVGALCKECDLYNIRGDGHFTKSNQQCLLCQNFNVKFIFQFSFAIFWQLLIVVIGYYSNYKLSQQYLMYKVGFKQFYQILYRQSIDQPSIYIKIYTNYVFMLYVIRFNFDLIGQNFVNDINIINNPHLLLQSQLDCLLSQNINLDIIYIQYYYFIFQIFFIISLIFTIYLLLIYLKLSKFQLTFIIFAIEKICLYNSKIIIDISSKLLSYNLLSGQKWIRQNLQYLFYSANQVDMMLYIIPISITMFFLPLLFPILMRRIQFLNRSAQRIYAIYYQEFKPQFLYWEYLIRYANYFIIIISILDDRSFAFDISIILILITAQSNFKPYYLINLNQYELNLFLTYAIQLNSIILSDYKDVLLICLNLFNFSQFLTRFCNSYYYMNITKIIQLKYTVTKSIKFMRIFTNVNKNERQLKNKVMLIYLTRTQILKKQSISPSTSKNIKLSIKEREIELGSIILNQNSSRIYPSRQESIE